MYQKFYALLLGLVLFGTAAMAQNPTKTIGDDDLVGGRSYTWSKDTTYLLDGFVYLEDGGILTIQPGTVIKGLAVPTTNDLASTLVITRGAQIFAEGTAREPIIFTAEDDTQDVNTSPLAAEDRGLWGGLILLGNATITDETDTEAVEGLNADDPRSIYGGNDDMDNSGVLRYVSIRHGGAELAPGEEINGLTVAGIGSGTTLEFVEVFANSDDGIEFFGGTANLRNASIAFCGDDGLDWDTGWRGKVQFITVLQSDDDGDNAAEMDGAKPDANTPSSNPQVYNATYVGSGVTGTAKNEHALYLRDGSRGRYTNSIFTDFANFGIQVEDRASGVDSRSYMEAGELVISNNIWFGFGEGSELNAGENGFIQATDDAEDATAQFLIDHLVANGNTIEDPQLGGISRDEGSQAYDPRPAVDGPAFSGLADYPDDDFYRNVNYKGAFGATLWIRNWTALDFYGFLPEQAEKVVRDEDLVAGGSYTWSSDTIYILDGFVYLEDGGSLTIEPGTVIKGQEIPSTADLASTLIIAQGATINAVGTADAPIIFTAEFDDTNDPNDLAPDDRGLWGGLILLGNATITDETDTEAVEGLNADDPRSIYGGNDDMDNSGTLKYVSIRHGGAELAPGEEINGLTVAAAGAGTTLEFIEVIANSDDGIEFFGGTASLKYATVAFCGDDAIDWDTGWRGKGQFWNVLQSADEGDNGAEMDGAKPDANTPSSNPQIYNVTYVGSGVTGTAKNEHALYFRDGSRGRYSNSIFTDYANFAIQVEDRASGVDSRSYMEAGELVLSDNVWFGFGEGNELNAGENGFIQATGDAEDPTAQFLIDHLAANGNSVEDPQLGGISRTTDGGYNPSPAADGPAYGGSATAYPTDAFYTPVTFKGAFCAEGAWIAEWTALAQYGVLSGAVSYTDFGDDFACDILRAERVIKDEDLVAGQTYNWSKDTIYLLDGFVYLENGGTLNIEAGTIIKGLAIPSTADLASTLIIAQGAQINAIGTKDAPIIFTAEDDDVALTGDVDYEDRGLWGGLILLGNATITDETDTEAVEGLNADDPRSIYGGADDMDNSGTLRYVSIRHGGAELAPGEEINGLTVAAVGAGTTLEYIEVIANSDDGIEFFGGTASIKNFSVAFCGDDAIDYDTGWRGLAQFGFVLQSDDEGDNAGEHDGAKPDANTPSSNPQFYNVTYIGSGVTGTAKNEHALYFRDGSRGRYSNSIITDFANFGIQVEDRASGVDSRSYMEAGELVISNNIWFGFGEGNELNAGENGFIQATGDAEDPAAQFLIDHLAANGNSVEDPQLGGISRDTDGGLDPRPAADGPAYADGASAEYPEDDFYTPVAFRGAFCAQGVWIAEWTALAQYGVLNGSIPFVESASCDLLTSTESFVKEDNGYKLIQNIPNPVKDLTQIRFELPRTATVNLTVYNMNGQVVADLISNERRAAGEYTVDFNATNLEDGIYFYSLTTEEVRITKPMVVNR